MIEELQANLANEFHPPSLEANKGIRHTKAKGRKRFEERKNND